MFIMTFTGNKLFYMSYMTFSIIASIKIIYLDQLNKIIVLSVIIISVTNILFVSMSKNRNLEL